MLIKIEEYKVYLIENEIAKNTIKNYMNTLEQLDVFLKENRCEKVDKAILIEFKSHLREKEISPGRKYQISTINQKLVAINVYFNWVEGTTEHAYTLKIFKQQTNNHKESINSTEFEQLRRHADKEMDLFMMTIANTGLRISEVCSLKKSDLFKAMINISNKGKDRTIDIPPFLKKQLKNWEKIKTMDEDSYIFDSSQQFYRNELKKIAGKARVKKSKVYPHSFRHYFAKEFISAGNDSSDLQQMLGHSSITTTTIYTKKNKEELADIYRKKIRNE